jgi:hypothetical protein
MLRLKTLVITMNSWMPGIQEVLTSSIRPIHYNGSSDGPNKIAFGMLKPNHGFLDDLVEPETLPSWLAREDVAYCAAEFSRTWLPWRVELVPQHDPVLGVDCTVVW